MNIVITSSRTSGVEKRQRETHCDECGEKHIVTNARTLSKMGFLSDRPNTFRRERLDLYWPIVTAIGAVPAVPVGPVLSTG